MPREQEDGKHIVDDEMENGYELPFNGSKSSKAEPPEVDSGTDPHQSLK